MTVRCGPYRCRRAKRMSPSQKISKKAPAARLIVCPYRARAHPLLSAHEGFGSLTIEKNIVLAAAAVDRLLARPQCDEIVELIKLGRMRHRGASELSGGQRRLLEIGMCLAQEARFLLMDEPFAGLNPMMVNVVCDVIQFLAKGGVGVVLVSHEIPIVRKHADRVIVMAQGAVLVDGAPEAALSDPRVVECYIGGGVARH
jgi:ABC-type branched-subunit amino acid transport system ATPase component